TTYRWCPIFEHKISKVINQPFKSIFGYVSSLFNGFLHIDILLSEYTEDASNNIFF
ncbi:19367_t:CDS:1, partial [Gigaspora margarita]